MRNVLAGLKKLIVVAGRTLFVLHLGTATAFAANAVSKPGDRVLAVIQSGPGAPLVDLSPDRQVLYVVSPGDDHFGNQPGEFAQIQLRTYDLTKPESPHLISTLALGELSVWRLVARGDRLIILHGWGDDDPKRLFGVMIVDVRDASHPTIAGNVAAKGDLELSRDGIARVSTVWPEKTSTAFRLDQPNQPLPAAQVRGDFERVSRFPESFPGPFGSPMDEASGRTLSKNGTVLHVLTPLRDGAPRRMLSVPVDTAIIDAKFVSDGAAAVVVSQDGVRIVSLAPPALDAARLNQVHARLLADYPRELKKRLAPNPNEIGPYRTPIPPKLDGFYLDLAIALEETGVGDLLDDAKAANFAQATRIAILNDYGFWLSKSNDPINAVEVLKKVVELAPNRAVAALNLGDATRDGITEAPTWQQKASLAKIGLQAYDAYRGLTGKDAPAAQQFAALHNHDFGDVCSYVAAFYNQGREQELFYDLRGWHRQDVWSTPKPIDLVGDGKLRYVYTFTQGTSHSPVIIATKKRMSLEEAQWLVVDNSEVDFGAQDLGWLAEPHVFPFKGSYYVVYEEDDGPSAVVKPDGPVTCRFKRSFTPLLVENHAPAICKKAAAGTRFEQVPRMKWPNHGPKIESEQLVEPHIDTASVELIEFSDVKLDPTGPPARLGYFEIASGAGRGCDASGLAFLNGDALEKSTRSTALMNAQAQMNYCAGSKAFLVQADGEVLIEIDAGQAVHQTTLPRLLLRLRPDKIETACRVEQRPSYLVGPLTETH
jgi:hypothetical protein